VRSNYRAYLQPSKEQKLEKRVASAEMLRLELPSEHLNGMRVVVSDNIIGKDALILRMGQSEGFVSQVAIHRPIGFDMSLDQLNDWVMSSLSSIQQYKSTAGNPFQSKTRERVSVLKENAAIRLSLLKKASDGVTLLYPHGAERGKELDAARKYARIHAKIPGATPWSPAFSYMDSTSVAAEIRLLNGMANDPQLKKEMAEVIHDYLNYQTKVPSTGQTQTAVPYLKGIPSDSVQNAVLEVMRTGKLNISYNSLIKSVPHKEHEFEMWSYTDKYDIDPQELSKLLAKLDDFFDAGKACIAVYPRSKEEKAKETTEAKAKREALNKQLDVTVKAVKEAENFKKAFPQVLKATGSTIKMET